MLYKFLEWEPPSMHLHVWVHVCMSTWVYNWCYLVSINTQKWKANALMADGKAPIRYISTRASERRNRKFWPFWKRWPYFKVYFSVDLVHSHRRRKGWPLGVLYVADGMMVVVSICSWNGKVLLLLLVLQTSWHIPQRNPLPLIIIAEQMVQSSPPDFCMVPSEN